MEPSRAQSCCTRCKRHQPSHRRILTSVPSHFMEEELTPHHHRNINMFILLHFLQTGNSIKFHLYTKLDLINQKSTVCIKERQVTVKCIKFQSNDYMHQTPIFTSRALMTIIASVLQEDPHRITQNHTWADLILQVPLSPKVGNCEQEARQTKGAKSAPCEGEGNKCFQLRW